MKYHPLSGGHRAGHGRSPCGERGLKCPMNYKVVIMPESLPVRGAWVEILLNDCGLPACRWSLPVRGAWVEISRPVIASGRRMSLPVRGAWGEIQNC